MKKVFKVSLYVAILLMAFTFSGCDKDEAQNAINTYINSLSATVNGSAFTSTNTNAAINAVTGGFQLTIDATSSINQRITLAIKNYVGNTGTFTVNGGSGTAIAAFNTGVTGAADLIGTSGQVIITAIDRTNYGTFQKIDGTFNFTTAAPVNTVTAGTFTVYAK